MMLEIREAGRADLPVLAALHRRCFPHEAWDENSLLGILGLPGGIGLIATDEEGETAGFVVAILVADLCDVATVCVLSERRQRGIGRALVEALAGIALRKGATEMTLEVGEKNRAARRLYEGLGFTVAGRRPNYYRDGDTALTLKRLIPQGFE
jgi:ribosomal-protein-alanine N-acetyltransferase